MLLYFLSFYFYHNIICLCGFWLQTSLQFSWNRHVKVVGLYITLQQTKQKKQFYLPINGGAQDEQDKHMNQNRQIKY